MRIGEMMSEEEKRSTKKRNHERTGEMMNREEK